MALPFDSAAKLREYAHPEMLVSTEWVAEHLDDPGLVVAESDEDVLLYETGHIPGAVKLDWHTELNDPVTRDYVDGAGLRPADVGEGHHPRHHAGALRRPEQLVGGVRAVGVHAVRPPGRAAAGRRPGQVDRRGPPAEHRRCRTARATEYPVVERDDTPIRAFQDQVLAHLGQPMIDVRSPGEYSGELLHMPDYPQEGALRGGHIPGAQNVPWARAAAEDATFRPATSSRRSTLGEAGLARTTTWSSTAASASGPATPGSCCTTCWATRHVRNYDGSWTEWGNSVRRAHHPRGRPVSTPARSTRGCRRSSTTSTPCRARSGCSCCWSSPRSCPPCPTGTPSTTTCWSRCRSASRRCSWRSRSDDDGTVHLFFDAPPEAPDHPRLRRHPARRAGRAERGRRSWPPRPSSPAAGAAGPGQPAAAARYGRHAGPHQAPGPRAARAADRRVIATQG